MRSFLGFGQVPYIGVPVPNPIKLQGIAGVAVPLLFNWIAYGASSSRPNINVLVSFENAICKALDQIRSIYIDNLGSGTPVYVYFPDTGYTVVAKANSEGWYPAYTNTKQVWVVGEGFLTGTVSSCSMLVSNLALAASVNTEIDNAVALWKASPVISGGQSIYNENFGVPALGDAQAQTEVTPASPTANIWAVQPSGFFYLTNVNFSLIGVYQTGTPGGTTFQEVFFESTGVSGLLYRWRFSAFNGATTPTQDRTVYSADSCQLKLDATQQWRLRLQTADPTLQGIMALIVNYTVNPNS